MDQTPLNEPLRTDPTGDERMGRYGLVAEGDRIVVVNVHERTLPVRAPGGGTRLVIELRTLNDDVLRAQLTISQANVLRRAVSEFLMHHDSDAQPAHDGGA